MTIASPPVAAGFSSRFRRVNFRMIGLLAVAIAPFLWFLFVVVQQTLTGGIVDRGDCLQVDLKTLGNFPFDPDKDTIQNVPEKWRALDGKKVMLEGEMFAQGLSAGATVDRFELVYSITKCCINGPPQVQERVYARMPKGKEADYGGQVRVIGTLRVKNEKDADRTISVYTLVVDSIKHL